MAGASGFLLGDDAVEFMRERGEQTWEAANEAGGCTAGWTDDCAQCGDDAGLRERLRTRRPQAALALACELRAMVQHVALLQLAERVVQRRARGEEVRQHRLAR